MRLAQVKNLKGNEIVAKTIIDDKFRQLIVKGTRYRKAFEKNLLSLGINQIYIDDELSRGIKVKDVVSDATRMKAHQIVSKQLEKFSTSKTVSVNKFSDVAGDIVDEIMNGDSIIYDLQDIKINDNYTFQHCVNVCVLAVLTAVKMDIPRSKIKKLAIGCLLHDFGKVEIPNEILNKKGKLTHDEFQEIKKHPIYGYEAFSELSPISRMVILMHHEKLDGTGYPLGFKDEKIYHLVKIASVCDVFDAMTSKRPYKKAISVAQTIKMMRASAGKHLDKEIMEIFFQNVAVYPVGSIVLLSNGLVGLIKKNHKTNMLRPKIKVVYDAKRKIKVNREIDLMDESIIKISKRVEMDKSGKFIINEEDE